MPVLLGFLFSQSHDFITQLIIFIYINSLQNTDDLESAPEFDGFVDLGKELAVLCALLQENLPKLTQVCRIRIQDIRLFLTCKT